MVVNLKKIRESRGLTYREMASLLGVTHTTVRMWERKKELPLSTLRILESAGFIELEIIPEQIIVKEKTVKKLKITWDEENSAETFSRTNYR